MGKKIEEMPRGLCREDESRCLVRGRLFSHSVFELWQSCSNRKLISDGKSNKKHVLGSHHPKSKFNLFTNSDGKDKGLRDKADNEKLSVEYSQRTVQTLMDEENSIEQCNFWPERFSTKKQKNLKKKAHQYSTKEAEAFINKALKKYLNKDRKNHETRSLLDALKILKSNEELFLKLLQDPNSLLAKHICNLQDLHAEKERSKLAPKAKIPEYSLKLRENPRALRRVEIFENVSCHCSSLHSHSPKNKNKILEPSYFSFKNKSKKLKGTDTKEFGKETKSKMKDTKSSTICENAATLDGNVHKTFDSSFLRDSKLRDFDIVEEEAKRHLFCRLKNAKKNTLTKETPRILGSILHLPGSQIFDSKLDDFRNCLDDEKGRESISSAASDLKYDDTSECATKIDVSQPRDIESLVFTSSTSSKNSTSFEQDIDTSSSFEEVEYSDISQHDSPLCLLQDPSSTPGGYIPNAELPSPVSILEPFFLEDINTPPSTIAEPAKPTIQPLRIDFEGHSSTSSSPISETNDEDPTDNNELISIYMKALLSKSSSSWEELFLSKQCPYTSYQFFDPIIVHEIKSPLTGSCDHKLFFDCVNEALSEVYHCYFSVSPFVSSIQSKLVMEKITILDEIKKRVNQYFRKSALPRTIEQLAGEGHVKSRTWMDTRRDVEVITNQVVDLITEKLVLETILEFLDSLS